MLHKEEQKPMPMHQPRLISINEDFINELIRIHDNVTILMKKISKINEIDNAYVSDFEKEIYSNLKEVSENSSISDKLELNIKKLKCERLYLEFINNELDKTI